MDVEGFTLAPDGHLHAQVMMPGHTGTAWRFCLDHPGRYPAIETAVADLRAALHDAVLMTMLEALPEAPDHPPLVKPCRICDVRTADNADDERGLTFCPDHRPKGTT